MQCVECEQPITIDHPFFTCVKCNGGYHQDCSGVTSALLLLHFKENKMPWTCPLCHVQIVNNVGKMQEEFINMQATIVKLNMGFSRLTSIASAYEQTLTDLKANLSQIEQNTNTKFSTLQQQIADIQTTHGNSSDIIEMKNALDQLKNELHELKQSPQHVPSDYIAKQDEQINYLRSIQTRENLVITRNATRGW